MRFKMINCFIHMLVGAFPTNTMKKHAFSTSMNSATQNVGDTIYALSSGAAVKAGVAVIRISGPASKTCLEAMIQNQLFPKPRMAALRWLVCPFSKEQLDKGLVLWFPGPKSFTGEDCVELHIHSGRAVIAGVLDTLGRLDNLTRRASNLGRVRPADRGEFTQRAFMNGKMDLTEVEGLADLLSAETRAQRKQALTQMDGKLADLYEGWREELLGCLAHTEAVIDFGDDDREDDVTDETMWAIIPRVKELRGQMCRHMQDGRRGEILREGVSIALVGPPNAGKSSLLNLLAKRPASIVSPIAGTTREALRQAEIKVVVSDVSDPQSVRSAVCMLDELLDLFPSSPAEARRQSISDGLGNLNFVDVDESEGGTYDMPRQRMFFVSNKVDAARIASNLPVSSDVSGPLPVSDRVSFHAVSCSTGEGVAELEAALSRAALALVTESPDSSRGLAETALITRDRHRNHVRQCIEHLDTFLIQKLPMDAAAEELRLAMMELGRITGRVDVDELLDVIFRDFCIGK